MTTKGNKSKMPLRSLMVYHEVARRESFSKAAKALSISQPAVTKHIKNLESRIGTSLINRDKADFMLSNVGRALFKVTKKISSHLAEVEELLAGLDRQHLSELKVGITEAYARCLLPDLLSGFDITYPNIKIMLNLRNSKEVEAGLLTYKNDLGLVGVSKRCPRFEYVHLLREDLVLITHPSHPLIRNEVNSLKEIINYPFVIKDEGSTTREIILHAFYSLGIQPPTLMEVSNWEFIIEWVARGKAVSIVPKTIAIAEERKGLIKIGALTENLHMDVAFVYLRERKADPTNKILKKFIDYIKQWMTQTNKPS